MRLAEAMRRRTTERPGTVVIGGFALLALLGGLALGQPARPAAPAPPRADYAAVAERLERFIAHEMDDKKVPGPPFLAPAALIE